MMVVKNKVFQSWMLVVFCSVGIFLTIPVAREIQQYVSEHWGRSLFGYFVIVVLSVGFLGLLYVLIFKLKIRTPTRYAWLILVGGLYGYFTHKLWKIPEEAIHFLEYGLLGFFLFKALNYNVKDKSIYITATLFALLIGTFDEIFQWIVPDRKWDFRDVGLNGLSGGLFQLAIWKVVRPDFIKGMINIKSLRIFTAIFSCCLIILGLCASNTPSRVYSYTKQISFLAFLQKEEPMGEFGYKYKDPEIGIFYSRLSLRELQKTDEKKSKEYARIFNESLKMKYTHFLQKYNPGFNAFLYEARIHIFRRDKYFNDGNKETNHNKKREFYFVSYKENLILQKYFTETVKNSVYWWGEDKIKKVEELIDENRSYESPVSASLFTVFSEKSMWMGIFLLLCFLLIINIIIHKLKNTSGHQTP